MKLSFILIIAIGMAAVVLADKSRDSFKSHLKKHDKYDLSKEWDLYKLRYKKNYLDSVEDLMRKEIFRKNFEIIREHNRQFEAGEITFKMRLNNFADWTEEEKQQMFGFKTDAELKETLDSEWEAFKKKYGKLYKTTEEDEIHKEIFRKKLILINKHNQKYVKGEVSFKMGLNKFCDWTPEQRKRMFGLKPFREITSVPKDIWSSYKEEYGKEYTGAEDEQRKDIYLKNLKAIRENNAKRFKDRKGFTMGVNQYSDWTQEELHKNGIDLSPEKEFEVQWENFKKKFEKNYSAKEDAVRKEIFRKNLDIIHQHNHKYEEGQTSFMMGANQYADWTSEEMKKLSSFKKM